jgi:hypothetical protein
MGSSIVHLINYPCQHILGVNPLQGSQPRVLGSVFQSKDFPIRTIRIIQFPRLLQIPLGIHLGLTVESSENSKYIVKKGSAVKRYLYVDVAACMQASPDVEVSGA